MTKEQITRFKQEIHQDAEKYLSLHNAHLAMEEYAKQCMEPYLEMDRDYTELVMKHNELKQNQDKLMIEFTEWILLKLMGPSKNIQSTTMEGLLKEFKEEKGITKPKPPCEFDHNGECLICDCWPSDCAWQRLITSNFKYETKEQLEKLFEGILPK